VEVLQGIIFLSLKKVWSYWAVPWYVFFGIRSKNFITIIHEGQFDNTLDCHDIVLIKNIFDSHSLTEIIFTSRFNRKTKKCYYYTSEYYFKYEFYHWIFKINFRGYQINCFTILLLFWIIFITHVFKSWRSSSIEYAFMFHSTVINDLKTHKCIGFSGVSSHYRMLVKKSKPFKTTSFPNLRYVTQARGKLNNVFIKEFVKPLPEINFIAMWWTNGGYCAIILSCLMNWC